MASQNRRSNNTNNINLVQLLGELEERRSVLLGQQRYLSAQIQVLNNQSIELGGRIEEVSEMIRQVRKEIQQAEELQEADRIRRREDLLRKRRELEKARAKARQWAKERERKRKN
jgi:hypothetical protein